MSLATEAEFVDPAGQSQGRELKAKNGSNFLPRLACEETKKDEFNEALCHQIYPFSYLDLFLIVIWY